MISVYDAINTVNRCEKTDKEKKKERLQECVKNCIEIVDRLILQEAEKGNEEIIITFLSFKKEDFDNKIRRGTKCFPDKINWLVKEVSEDEYIKP